MPQMAHQASQPLPPPRAANKVEASPLCTGAAEFMFLVQELWLAVVWRVCGSVPTEDSLWNTASGIFPNTAWPSSWKSVACVKDVWLCYLAKRSVVTVSRIKSNPGLDCKTGGVQRHHLHLYALWLHTLLATFFHSVFNTFRLLSEGIFFFF